MPDIKKDLHIDIGHNTYPHYPKKEEPVEPVVPFVGNGVCFIDGADVDIKLTMTAEEGQPTSIAGTIQV